MRTTKKQFCNKIIKEHLLCAKAKKLKRELLKRAVRQEKALVEISTL